MTWENKRTVALVVLRCASRSAALLQASPCYLQMMDQTQFYLSLDPQLFIDSFKAELQYMSNNWQMLGRPTIIFPVGRTLLGA